MPSALQIPLHANLVVLDEPCRALLRDLTADVIRTGSFGSVKGLVDYINAYLAERNANPRPYKWKAKARPSSKKSIAPEPPSAGARSRELLVTICESGH